MKVLVLGATGMLGSDLVAVLRNSGHEVTGFSSRDLDLTNHKAIRDCAALTRKKNDWVVNCAAFTAVDRAEQEPELPWDLNVEAVLNLTEKLQNGPRLLHISTDFVFDGTKGSPYVEDDEVNPLGVYGQTKLVGERYVEAMLDDGVIFRTSWLYGPNGKSFPRTMIEAYDAGKQLRVVADQTGCPTYTLELAMAIEQALAMNIGTGIYHAVGSTAMTWHGFAEQVLSTWRDETVKLEAISTAEYPTPAVRPPYSVLSTAKLSQAGISPWRTTQECLTDFCNRLRKIKSPGN